MYAASIHSSTRTCVSHAFYCHGPKCVCVSFVKLVLYFSAPPRTIGVVVAALSVDCATRSRFGSSRLHYIRSVCVCVSAPLVLRKRTREAQWARSWVVSAFDYRLHCAAILTLQRGSACQGQFHRQHKPLVVAQLIPRRVRASSCRQHDKTTHNDEYAQIA